MPQKTQTSMCYIPKTSLFPIRLVVPTTGLCVLTNSCVSSCSGKNAASRIAIWSTLSFCHSPISRITRWVALFSLVNDWNRLSWFSSIASARAITCRNQKLQLGIISQCLSPQQVTFGTLLFLFKTLHELCPPQTQAMLSNKRVIIHLLTSFIKECPK